MQFTTLGNIHLNSSVISISVLPDVLWPQGKTLDQDLLDPPQLQLLQGGDKWLLLVASIKS